jgi:hypothetical protein
MNYASHEQESLVNILLRYWGEISALEEEWKLPVGNGDRRPRIEFFHDAIRAYTTPHKTAADSARLSVERLAYDVRCLRYIATQPLASITHDKGALSAANALIPLDAALVPAAKKIGRDVKGALRELYEKYGVLFSALLRATAEHDYQDRADAMNEQVEHLHQIIEALARGASTQELTTLAQHLDDGKQKRDLLALLPQIKGKNASGLIAKLKGETQRKDKAIKTMDASYHDYSTSQLAIYESAKDMLKSMAGQGMNLVGQFVEASLRGTDQTRSR